MRASRTSRSLLSRRTFSIFIIVIQLFLPLIEAGAANPSPVDDGLIYGNYRQSSSRFPSTLSTKSGSSTLSLPQAGSDHSLSLNGTTAYATNPNSGSLNITGPITVEAWIKLNSTTGDQAISSRYGTAQTDGGWQLIVTGGKLAFATLKNGYSGNGDWITGTTTLSTGTWYHVAGVYNGSQLRVYVNGVLDGSKNSTFAPASGTQPHQIGGFQLNGTLYYPFNGLIDEVRVSTGAIYASNFSLQAHLSVIASTRGLWKFDGQTPNDSTENNNHCSLIGSAGYSTDVPSDYNVWLTNRSLQTNGTTTIGEIYNSSSLNITGSITVEAWVKTNTTSGYQRIVSRYGASDGGYVLDLASGKPTFYTLVNPSSLDSVASPTAVSTGVWHHVAGVFDGSQLRIYVDGVLAASKSSTAAPGTGTKSVFIGITRYEGTNYYPFNGLIDEVRITAAPVYTSNFTPDTHLGVITNTKGLWKFDSQSLLDFSGNGNHITLYNGSYSTDVPGGNSSTQPATPTQLAASSASTTEINLSWTDYATAETGFKIERKTGAGGTFSQVATAGANATSYTDTGLTASTQYYYRVRANTATGNSPYSNEATATTQDPPNTLPTVSITSPANEAGFTASANVTVTVNASDSDGTISKVEFFDGPTKLGESTTSPFSFSWNSVAVGNYNLTAKATDNRGGTTTSNPVYVLVNGASQTGANSVSYAYDDLGRLVAVTSPTGEAATYSYDSVGNLLSITRTGSTQVSIANATPGSGTVGTEVTIYGTGFSNTPGQNGVRFNGVATAVISATATQLVVKVPAGATTGTIAVVTPSGSATSATSFVVVQGNANAPTITSFSPTIGSIGSTVTISGTNFETVPTNNKVKVNATGAIVNSATASSLVTTVTSGSVSGRISVRTPAGIATSSSDFFVPPSPLTAADVDTTARMSVGETKSFFGINTADKVGLLIFDGVAGRKISLLLTNLNCNASVKIYAPGGWVLGSVDGAYMDVKTLPATGTYTILFDPTGTEIGGATFTLFDVVDITDPITPGGAAVSATVNTPGQLISLPFNGTAGQRVSLKVNSTFPDIQYEPSYITSVQIKKPDGTVLTSIDANHSTSLFIEPATLPTTGAYTVKFDAYKTSTGSMTFTLYDVPADVTGTITPGGSSVTKTVTTPGQNIRLSFDGTAGQKVSVVNSMAAGSPWFNVSILKPDGTALTGVANSFIDAHTLPVTGTYTLFGNPLREDVGTITFTLYDAADVTGTITPGGSAVPVTISSPGQVARLTFDGTAGQKVNLSISSNSFYYIVWTTVDVRILKPDGTALTSMDINGQSTASTGTQTLPVTGTYTVLLDPGTNRTGGVTFTLTNVP